jgi:CRISPR system Cascade subunit CasA
MAKAERAKPLSRGEPAEPARTPVAPRWNLLDEPLIGVETSDGARRGASLPEVLALLGRDEVRAFTAMQAHQQHGWHAFVVQLACIALHHGGESEPRQGAQRWRELLLALTRRSEPWCLVVEDLSQAAFMQPPVPEGTLEGFKDAHRYPDEIDVLVTSKNHDVKATRIAVPRPEHWIYALATLQTMEATRASSTTASPG